MQDNNDYVSESAMMHRILTTALEGLPGFSHADNLGKQFLQDARQNREKAVSDAINSFGRMGSMSGFASGVGGLMYSVMAMPTDLFYQMYLGVRLSLVIASIYGLNLASMSVKSMAMACALGVEAVASVGKILSTAATKGLGKKVMTAGLGPTVYAINRVIGYRFMTISASKTGAVSLVKMVPFVGGLVGAGFNYAGLHAAGSYARTSFCALEA